MEEVLKKLGVCFERLQHLDIQPTLSNMENLTQTLYDLRDAYNMIEKEVGSDGRDSADTE